MSSASASSTASRSMCAREFRNTTTGNPDGSGGAVTVHSSFDQITSSLLAQRQQSASDSPVRDGSASTGGTSSRTRIAPSNGNVTHSSTGGIRRFPRARSKSSSGVSGTKLHAHRVIARVDVERRPGHVPRVVGEQVRGGRTDVVRVDVPAKRRAFLDDRLHGREAGDRARGKGANGSRRDRVHAYVLLT